jgi:drug/metabolite transporter (DMT)-like permease
MSMCGMSFMVDILCHSLPGHHDIGGRLDAIAQPLGPDSRAPVASATMTDRRSHLDTRAASLLVACCAFWGLQQILIKTTTAEVPPMWQATLRMCGAVLLLWLWCRWRGIRLFERDGTLPAGLLAGALFAAEFVCIYLGLGHTTASRLTVFVYTAPFVVALLLPRFVPAERLRGLQWVGLALAFAGVVIAFGESFGHGSAGTLHGDVLALLAGAMWGLTTLTIRTTRLATASAEKTLFYQIAVTAAASPLVSALLGERWGWAYSGYAWFSIGLQTAVGAFASYLAWMWLLRIYPATRISSFTFLTPVFALFFGVVLLKEALTPQLLVALFGVGCGILLVNRKARAP